MTSELGDRVYNNSFSLKLTSGPNKLECCIKLDKKGLPGTNALAYLAHWLVSKKIKCCE